MEVNGEKCRVAPLWRSVAWLDDPPRMASEPEPIRIVLEISRAEPLRGTIAEHAHPLQSFDGWTGFAAAIAAIVRRMDSAGAPEDGQDGLVGG